MTASFLAHRALADFLRGGRAADVSVAVLGDIVLDRYLSGSTRRVSREAPIPVMVCDDWSDNLGGAGNVAANLSGIGCGVFLAGMAGEDEFGGRIRAHLDELRVKFELLPRSTPTLAKTRVICGGSPGNPRSGQQIARFDYETAEQPGEDGVARTLKFLGNAADAGVRAVILSDYGLGFCTPAMCRAVIEMCRSRGVFTLVDPRGSDWSKYRGASMVTPNLGELEAVCGGKIANEDGEIAEAGSRIREDCGIDRLLVTRGAKGMSLIEDGGVTHVAAKAVEVFDVSGAGDTVVAVTAALYAAGFGMEPAVRMANEAAQFVITRSGTYALNAADYLAEAGARTQPLSSPIADAETAAREIRRWQEEGLRVVFTNGCFDVLHAGHLDSLTRSRMLGDRLVVGLNSDRSVRALKGPSRPVNGQSLRASLLAALRPVDMVVIFDEDTPAELLSALRPNVLAKGGDYSADELPGRESVEEVVILPLVDGLSTTNIIKMMSGRV